MSVGIDYKAERQLFEPCGNLKWLLTQSGCSGNERIIHELANIPSITRLVFSSSSGPIIVTRGCKWPSKVMATKIHANLQIYVFSVTDNWKLAATNESSCYFF